MSLYSRDQENAITPAIATILIVLMTVVLAAGVAAVTLGMVEKQPEYVVGLTAKAAPAGKDVTVTLYGSRNIPELVKAEVIDAGSSSGNYVEVWNGSAGTAPVGVPLVAEGVARPAVDRTEQVLLMQAMTFRNVSGGESGASSDLLDGIEDYIQSITVKKEGNLIVISIVPKGNENIIKITDNDGEEITTTSNNNQITMSLTVKDINASPTNPKKYNTITISVTDVNGTELAKKTYSITISGTITPN